MYNLQTKNSYEHHIDLHTSKLHSNIAHTHTRTHAPINPKQKKPLVVSFKQKRIIIFFYFFYLNRVKNTFFCLFVFSNFFCITRAKQTKNKQKNKKQTNKKQTNKKQKQKNKKQEEEKTRENIDFRNLFCVDDNRQQCFRTLTDYVEDSQNRFYILQRLLHRVCRNSRYVGRTVATVDNGNSLIRRAVSQS